MAPYVRVALMGATIVGCSEGNVESTLRTVDVFDGSIRLEEDGTASVVLTAEVSTADTPTFEIVSEPGIGQLVGSGAVYQYVPDENVNGTDEFTFRAFLSDQETSETATVTVFIDPVNDAPRGQGSMLVTQEDTPDGGPLPASDVEGDPLSYSLVQAPEFGRVDIGTDGTYVYTPDRNYVGTDSFLWAATDDSNASTGPVRVDINVAEENDPPVVQDNGFVGQEDEVLDGALVATDPDGDDLTWSVRTQPANGTLNLNTNFGSFSYTPDPNFFGADSFEVVASDAFADSEPSTVDVTITSVNDRPVVTPAVLVTDEDTPLTGTALATDVEAETLSYRIGEPPRNGIVAINANNGEFTYTPNPNTNGVDDFTVIASDTTSNSLPGRITITVTPVNDAPRLDNVGLLTTNEDTIVTGVVSGSDPEGDTLIFEVVAPPSNGSVTVSPVTGALAYTPSLNFNGLDQFQVTARDAFDSSPPAIVDVLVRPVNDAPVPDEVQLTTIGGEVATTTLSAVDPEGDTLYFLIVTPPKKGTAVVDTATGEVTYTLGGDFEGSDVLMWQVTDGQLSTNSVLPITVSGDADRDGIGDSDDNCPDVANPEQTDASGNGVGDLCDCYVERFGPDLNEDFFADSYAVSPVDNMVTSETHALRFNGDGAYAETVGLPGCASFYYEVQLAEGPPAPEVGDIFRISARIKGSGDPWTTLTEIAGTGVEESFDILSGQTNAALDLSGGDAEFRFEVIGDEPDDLFFIDDLKIECDTDADFLIDCFEARLPGFDLTEADADGDGVLDADEWANGSDPNVADTDFDGVSDLLDNCPVVVNQLQTDDDGDGWGNACDAAVMDLFEAGVADLAMWTTDKPTGDGEVSTTNAWSGTQSLRMGLDSNTTLETNPLDLSECLSVGWNFKLMAGIRGTYSYPFPGAWIRLQYFDGVDWITMWERNGHYRTYHDFVGIQGNTVDPDVLQAGTVFRLATTAGSHAGDWYVDDFTIGCDSDGDTVPDAAEREIWSSNTVQEDTDQDGVPDDMEVGIGTDPTNPNDARLMSENETSNNSPALADQNAYSVFGPGRWYLPDALAENGAADFYRFDVIQNTNITVEVVDIPDVMQCYSYYDVLGVYQSYKGYHRLAVFDSTGNTTVAGPSWGYTSYDKYYCGTELSTSLSPGTYYVRVDNQYTGYDYEYALQVDFD